MYPRNSGADVMVYVLDTGIYTRSIMRLKAAQGGVRHSSQMRGMKTRTPDGHGTHVTVAGTMSRLELIRRS